MNYQNPQLRDKLAAEYVLGTLTFRARRRFTLLLKYDVELRRTVGAWERRLMPLALQAAAVVPPARVWQAIAARIGSGRLAAADGRTSSSGWRSAIAVGAVSVIMLATILVTRQPAGEILSTVAVLTDGKSAPAMVVSWPPQNSPRQQHVKLKMLAPPALPPGKSFELWMLPGGNAAPVSLGVIGADLVQTVTVSDYASKMLPKIAAMAVSVEPAGGSKTGLPTGPVILSGPCVKVI